MTAATATQRKAPSGLSNKAREMMEAINTDAARHHVWVRTQANAPAQRPWFSETSGEGSGQLASGRVAANQMKTLPHLSRWSEFSPYLHRISEIARKADVSPIEFADRQSILLLNPGLNGRLQVTNTIRCAISIYNPGDVAPVHLHSPMPAAQFSRKKAAIPLWKASAAMPPAATSFSLRTVPGMTTATTLPSR